MPDPHPQPNLRSLVSPSRTALRLILALSSGLLLSAAFPPLEWNGLAWMAFVPLLLAPIPATGPRRAALGYLFGLAHYLTNLFWLNTIGFGAGILLAGICALFPMLWYLTYTALVASLRPHRAQAAPMPHLWQLPQPRQCLLVFLPPAVWVTLEWTRSWIFTGFSWNQLGVSQWSRPNLLVLTTVTGVYGITFLIVAANTAVALTLPAMVRRREAGISWPLVACILLFLPVMVLTLRQTPLGAADAVLRVTAIQGCIPQCRVWTQAQLDDSLKAYTSLSRAAANSDPRPDLIVWPETAIPAPARWDEQYTRELTALFPDLQTHVLLGTIDYRPVKGRALAPGEEPPVVNSAMLFGPTGALLEAYDKMHTVPFGEYTPFSRHLPWLQRWIGMGRDLTSGTEFTVFHLPQEVRAGVMICYEDAFPEMAREFVRRGADLLITITNDAWYAESAGPRQHLLHAVLRAAENRRPLLRSGNNSDSCLITPTGQITELLADPVTGYRFIRGYRTYAVNVWRDQPLTWYARHGDLFAHLCAGVTLLAVAGIFWRWMKTRERCRDAVAAGAE